MAKNASKCDRVDLKHGRVLEVTAHADLSEPSQTRRPSVSQQTNPMNSYLLLHLDRAVVLVYT